MPADNSPKWSEIEKLVAMFQREAAETRPPPDEITAIALKDVDTATQVDYIDPFDYRYASGGIDEFIGLTFHYLASMANEIRTLMPAPGTPGERDKYAGMDPDGLAVLKSLRGAWIDLILAALNGAEPQQVEVSLGNHIAALSITINPESGHCDVTVDIFGPKGAPPAVYNAPSRVDLEIDPGLHRRKLEFAKSVNDAMIAPCQRGQFRYMPNPGGKMFDQMTIDERIQMAVLRGQLNAQKSYELGKKIVYTSVRIRPYDYYSLADVQRGFHDGDLDRNVVSVLRTGRYVTLSPPDPASYQYQSTWERLLNELIAHAGIPFRIERGRQGPREAAGLRHDDGSTTPS